MKASGKPREIWFRRRREGLLKYAPRYYPVHWKGTATMAMFLLITLFVLWLTDPLMPNDYFHRRLMEAAVLVLPAIALWLITRNHYEDDQSDGSDGTA